MSLERSRTIPCLTAALLLLASAASAQADDRKRTGDASLPGVDRTVGAPAAAPLPEPDDALPAGSQPGSFRVGNWDVTISGSISYEIGTGRPRDGR